MKTPGGGQVHRDWFGLGEFHPGPRFVRDGAALYLLDTVGSTSDFLRGKGEPARGRLCTWDGWGWAAAAARSHDPIRAPRPGTVVVARRQTAGRGRQGRTWDDCGGLNLSVVIPAHRVDVRRGFSVWLGLVAVLALREEFHLDARLKWPNDIVIGDRKLGGILLQQSGATGDRLVVGGLGLNLSAGPEDFPAALQGTATSFALETGRTVSRGAVAGRIIARVDAELDAFRSGGWQPYRHSLSLLDALLGRDVRLVEGGRIHRGRAVGIDDSGGLRMALADGTITIFHAGDAHLLPAGNPEETA